MTDTENHMVIGNEVSDMDDLRDRIKRNEDRDLVNSAAEILLSGAKICRTYDFDDVLVRAWEDDSFPDCAKEILDLYPDSKLAKLITHMAVVVAADALDIEI